MANNSIAGTIVQLNEYPPDKFNVLIPVTTMQVMSNLQRIIVNKVQLDVSDPENSKDVYREKSSGKYAITKVGGMKLAAAANISIVDTESGMTDGCKRCVDMARAVGKPKACGTCPAQYNVAVTVTIRVPEPSGGFRLMKATREIDCAAEKESMTDAQYKRFLPHRTAMAESKAFMRALRAALGLAATYTIPELRKPFIIAHVVPNLEAPEIKEAVAANYLQSMGMLFEGAGSPRAAISGNSAALPAAVDVPDDGADSGYPTPDIPDEPDDAPDFENPNLIFCDDCGEQIVETQARNGQTWTPENIRSYSKRQYGRCLCAKCQKAERASMLNDKTTEICKRLDWSIYLDANEDVELRKESPAGEDFSICVDSKNFIQNVKEYAANFDIDEHIELWIEAKRNGVKGVPSARELVYDAEAICKMLQELAAALAKEEPA